MKNWRARAVIADSGPPRHTEGLRRAAFLASIMAVSICFCLSWGSISFASQNEIKPEASHIFDFAGCVRYALVHSEDFTKTRIDIQVRSADLKDAHSELLPTLQLITRYYITRATSNGSGQGSFSIQLFMTNWDPYLALLKIKSHGILVDIGKLSHYEKIADNINKMAKLFYRIHVLEKMIRSRKQITALAQNRVNFAKSRMAQGAADSLDVRSLENTVRSESLRVKGMEQEIEQRTSELKFLMGFHPDYHLNLDTRDAANQILNGFDWRMITFMDVQGRNLSLRILAKQEQLQSNRVTGSYVALIPKPLFVLEQVENQVDRTSGFNLALGLDYTLWDGFKRVRDIKRQKLKAEQLKIDRSQYSQRVYGNFKRLRAELETSGDKEGVSREQAKLAELLEEKAFLMFKSGDINYDQYMVRRIERAEADLNSMGSGETRVEALIDLATMAGGLNNYNAGIRF